MLDPGVRAAARQFLDATHSPEERALARRQAVLASGSSVGETWDVPLLRAQLVSELDQDEAAAVRRCAAFAAFAEHRALDAIRFAVEGGDWQSCDEFLQRDWMLLRAAYPAQTRRVLLLVPRSERLRLPMIGLVVALASNALPAHRQDATAALDDLVSVAESVLYAQDAQDAQDAQGAQDAQDAQGPPISVRVLLGMTASARYRVRGRPEDAGRIAASVLTLLDHSDPRELVPLEPALPTVLAQLGQSFHLAGEVSQALESFARAGSSVNETDDGSLPGLSLYSELLAEMGQIRAAESVVSQLRTTTTRPTWWDGYPASSYQVAEAWIAIESMEPARAHRHLDRLTGSLEWIERHSPITRARAMAHLAGGDLPAALTLMRSAPHPAAAFHGVPGLEYALTRAFVELASGEVETSDALLQAIPGPVSRIMRSLAALTRNDPKYALDLLPRPKSGDPLMSQRISCHRDLIRAASLARLGDTAAARECTIAVTERMIELGLSSPLWMMPEEDQLRVVGLIGAPDLLAPGRPRLFSKVSTRPLLSSREMVVLRQLTTERSVAEIARALHVSPNTVKSQLRAVYRKLGVQTREAALVRASQIGL